MFDLLQKFEEVKLVIPVTFTTYTIGLVFTHANFYNPIFICNYFFGIKAFDVVTEVIFFFSKVYITDHLSNQLTNAFSSYNNICSKYYVILIYRLSCPILVHE